MLSDEPLNDPITSEESAASPDTRFLLANERTFLAYQRTAAGLVGAGLAVVHLLDPAWSSRLLGVLLVVAGGIAAGGGYLRFCGVDAAMRGKREMPGFGPTHLLAAAFFLCLLAAVASLVVVLV
jgi:putative membrane protein